MGNNKSDNLGSRVWPSMSQEMEDAFAEATKSGTKIDIEDIMDMQIDHPAITLQWLQDDIPEWWSCKAFIGDVEHVIGEDDTIDFYLWYNVWDILTVRFYDKDGNEVKSEDIALPEPE